MNRPPLHAWAPACLAITLGLASLAAEARVVRISIDTRTPVSNGASFGSVGAYELLRGVAHGEIDPADPRNARITDIELAPRNAAGRVEYRSQFSIHMPTNLGNASGVMLYNVPNRGNIAIPYTADDAGFLWRRGDILVHNGWQGDLPITSPTSSGLGLDAPIAKLSDGSPVVGPVISRFVAVAANNAGVWQSTQSLVTAGRTTFSTDTQQASLISATRETPSGVKSGVVTIAPADFAFADCRSLPFPGTPDPTRLCVRGGFNPALLYELVYLAKDPYVLGVGNAAMRDVISFFRHAQADDFGNANPLAGRIETVIGFGNSQSGRFQKHMINNGFNEDEAGRRVWDGVNTNIAGMMGSFNIRFAQPGDIAELYLPGADGPLWWADYTDTVRGRPSWGLLTRCTQTNTCPKITETYGGPEVWYSRGSVGWTGTAGTEDLPLPANVRRYYHAGTSHGGGSGGYNLGTASSNPATFAGNPNPQNYINRALYVALVDWVRSGREPPPSAYAKLADGTLVQPTSAAMGWPDIPGAPKPDGVMNPVLDYDFGPLFRYNDGSGVISNVPAPIRQTIPTLAPRVNQDGNEVAGVHSLLHRLPLGTYSAWNPIASGPLQGREASLAAGYMPFARTRADRMATGDPRLSIEERYSDVWSYYNQATKAANQMVRERLMLPEDAARQLNRVLSDMLASGLLPLQPPPPPVRSGR